MKPESKSERSLPRLVRRCRHSDDDVECIIAHRWCRACGSIGIIVPGNDMKVKKWIKPKNSQ